MSVDIVEHEVAVEEEYVETPSDSIGNTRLYARMAHGKQTDKAGRPYVTHLDAVAHNVYLLVGMDRDLIQAAFLHDTLEDTAVQQRDLEDFGYSERTVHAVLVVTKRKGEANWDYTTRVTKGGTGPMIVKLADLYHNASPKRLAELPSYTADRLREKYFSAIWRIERALVKEGVLTEMDKTISFDQAYEAVKPISATNNAAWEWKKRHPASVAKGDRIRFKADPSKEFTVEEKRVKSNGKYSFTVSIDGETLGMEIVLDYNVDQYETMWRTNYTVTSTGSTYVPQWKKRLGLPAEWEPGDPIPDVLAGDKE